MSTQRIVESLWDAFRSGDYQPAQWKGKLTVAEAYAVQLGMLARKLAGGEAQAGWKVGLTAPQMREMFRNPDPVFGHLLDSARKDSGHRFTHASLRSPAVENELMITLGSDLSGPDATPDQVRAAIASVAPALEIVELGRADMRSDLALGICDNVAQCAFVHGAPVPMTAGLDFGAVRATVEIDGQLVADVVGRDVIDNQLHTLAWLVNALHRFGASLRAGDRIMTGSFTRPLPVAAGAAVRTTFAGIGTVEARFD